jgi:PQQ-like domain
MKRRNLAGAAVVVFSAFVTSVPAAEGGVTARPVRFDGPGQGADVATDVAVAPDGRRVFVTGEAFSGLEAGEDFTTVAYDPAGRELWAAAYDGPDGNIDQANAVAVDPAGESVYVTGSSFGGQVTLTDLATVAYDAATGEERWAVRYDGPFHDTDAGADVVVDPSGTAVYVTGASVGADGSFDALTVAYDAATGGELWVARQAGAGAATEEGLSMAVSPNGSRVFVGGYTTGTSIDFLALAYATEDGRRVWSRQLDRPGEEVGRDLAVSPTGNAVYITGGSTCVSQNRGGGIDYLTVAFATGNGLIHWKSAFDGPAGDCDESYGVTATGDAVFVTGSSLGVGTDFDYATVAYRAADGVQDWVARYDGPDSLYDRAGEIEASADGSRVFVSGVSTGATTDYDVATVAYAATTGAESWSHRYDGPGHGFDAPNGMAVDAATRRLYVAGTSADATGSADYVTLLFRPPAL